MKLRQLLLFVGVFIFTILVVRVLITSGGSINRDDIEGDDEAASPQPARRRGDARRKATVQSKHPDVDTDGVPVVIRRGGDGAKLHGGDPAASGSTGATKSDRRRSVKGARSAGRHRKTANEPLQAESVSERTGSAKGLSLRTGHKPSSPNSAGEETVNSNMQRRRRNSRRRGGEGEPAADDDNDGGRQPTTIPLDVSTPVGRLASALVEGTFNPEAAETSIFVDGGVAMPKFTEIKNFGSQPSLQQVYDNIKLRLKLPTSTDDESISERDFIVPVFGTLTTHNDFSLYLNQLYHVDTYVDKFAVVLNGASPRGELILHALEALFGKDRFYVKVNQENQGVSSGWNSIIRFTFGGAAASSTPAVEREGRSSSASNIGVVAGTDPTGSSASAAGDNPTVPTPSSVQEASPWYGDPFCIVGNADVQPKANQLGQWARDVHAKKHQIVNSRFAHFAMFAVTRFGFDELGYFDEVIFPAYAEDVEYHIRAVSRGLGLENGPFSKFGSNNAGDTYLHNHATNLGTNRKVGEQVGRWQKESYIAEKWGVNMGSTVDFQFCRPHSHPWNNKHIWHSNSWIVDPKHRSCIRNGPGGCSYNKALTKRLEQRQPQPPTVTRRARKMGAGGALEKLLEKPGYVWLHLGDEGVNFELKEKSLVRFIAGTWVENVLLSDEGGAPNGATKGEYHCGSETFAGKDPAPGKRKACQIHDPRAGAWRHAADEGNRFQLAGGGGDGVARFGTDDAVQQLLPSGQHQCAAATFKGSDPAGGSHKTCEIWAPATTAAVAPKRQSPRHLHEGAESVAASAEGDREQAALPFKKSPRNGASRMKSNRRGGERAPQKGTAKGTGKESDTRRHRQPIMFREEGLGPTTAAPTATLHALSREEGDDDNDEADAKSNVSE